MTQGSVAFRGLGVINTDCPDPWLGCENEPAAATPSASETSWIDKALDIFKTASEVYSNTRQAGSGAAPGYTPPPAPSPAMSTGVKVLIGVGVASFIGGVVYFATRKKKK